MARSHLIQSSFNAGELSPRIEGRVDINKYSSGAALLQNFVVQAQGGIKHRSGTRFVLEVKSSANKTRLIPFVVSTIQAYILEFSNLLIRFYKDEANIESGGNPLELVTLYTTAQIPDLVFAQTVDALYIAHTAHPLRKITRTSDTAWTIADVDLQDGPYLAENLTTTTFTLDVATVGTGRTLTASAVTGINGGDGFKSSDVGRLFRSFVVAADPDQVGWGEITAFTSTTVVTVEIKAAFEAVTATVAWRLGAFGSDTDLGFPSVMVFYEQRLWLGANPGAAQTVYGSVISLFETFSPTDLPDNAVLDDSGIVYTIASDQINTIRWMDSTRTMILGTARGLWPVQATTTLEAITPTNIQIKRSHVAGAASVAPAHVDDISVYVSATKRQVLSAGYEGDRDTYVAEDLTLLSDQITESGIDEIAYAREPHSVVWCVRNDGVLVGLTSVNDQQVFAWHRHVIGGIDAVVESVAVIPSPSGDPSSIGRTNIPHDQVWLIVRRTINSATVRYVEFIEDDFSDTDILDDAFYVDSGFTYDSTATSTITSGITHLEGETVQILADGATHPDRTVASGSITLDDTYSTVHVGLYSNARVDTLNLEPPAVPGATGVAQARLKRIPILNLRLDRSLGGEFCSNIDNSTFDPIFYRVAGEPMDSPPSLFTGDKRVGLECGWVRQATVSVRQAQPLPFNLLALISTVEVSER